QKVIEECPSPLMSPALRKKMGHAAIKLAQSVGYVNAGTMEFLVDNEGHYYFIEMNTRIQVEHTITEEVYGCDLVKEQILIAARPGRILHHRNQDDGSVSQCDHAQRRFPQRHLRHRLRRTRNEFGRIRDQADAGAAARINSLT